MFIRVLALAQTKAPVTVSEKIDGYMSRASSDKVFLQFDQSAYAVGDTLRFKAYLLNSSNRQPSDHSDKVYVELLGGNGILKTVVLPMAYGVGSGYLDLDPKLEEGVYTVRAYTNWMQNWSAERFFTRTFYIGRPTADSWLINEQHQLKSSGGKDEISMTLTMRTLDGLPVIGKDITVFAVQKNKKAPIGQVHSGVDGSFAFVFAVPRDFEQRPFQVTLVSQQPKRSVTFPFLYPERKPMTLLFFPEGGTLLAGSGNRIAFKAVTGSGTDVPIKGSIVDSRNKIVTTFESIHNGIGDLVLDAKAGEHYQARLTSPAVPETVIDLPEPQNKGLLLAADASSADSLRLNVRSNDLNDTARYALVVQGKDTLYFALEVRLKGGRFGLSVPKKRFAAGIIGLSLLNGQGVVMADRRVFIDHGSRFAITAVPVSKERVPGDSVAVRVNITDQNGRPVVGSFSVTVAEDQGDVIRPAINHVNSYAFLTSELDDTVADPDWYLSGNAGAARALDDLILATGWSGFEHDPVSASTNSTPRFRAEKGDAVEGRVLQGNKPAKGLPLILFTPQAGGFYRDTTTDALGRFRFPDLLRIDTPVYSLKVHKVNGKEIMADIQVDEFRPAAITTGDTTIIYPWFLNISPQALGYFKAMKDGGPLFLKGNGKLLKEVEIKGRRPLDVKGLNGEEIYNSDGDFNEERLVKEDRLSLLQYLEKYMAGFRSGTYRSDPSIHFLIKNRPLAAIIIDGISTNKFYSAIGTADDYYEFQKGFLEHIDVSTISRMVVYHKESGKMGGSFIVIKTRGGQGVGVRNSIGSYVYRALPYQAAIQAYRPRSFPQERAEMTAARRTAYWQPNLVTDTAGNATFSFYPQGKNTRYRVLIEGTDVRGHFGYLEKELSWQVR